MSPCPGPAGQVQQEAAQHWAEMGQNLLAAAQTQPGREPKAASLQSRERAELARELQKGEQPPEI